jgi:hypothetical protein
MQNDDLKNDPSPIILKFWSEDPELFWVWSSIHANDMNSEKSWGKERILKKCNADKFG